jgi:predicted heme/steroid binding protein
MSEELRVRKKSWDHLTPAQKGEAVRDGHAILKQRMTKQRFGLPEDFVSRAQRYGRSVLLEENIYRLPNGKEFIPCRPKGALAARSHVYALVTLEQFQRGETGSVYVRTDGKIFDYSTANSDSAKEFFETAYSMNDLERTGRYATDRKGKSLDASVKVRKRAANTG